ncbi:hypothetical protein L873DRAFT_83677 [Choiromyces venosus 120613-1]|uniref:Uncharacterized protein n=1 Tax=Choiromyces venosus 120613-1 TaxID=1336337 RepID=A0A3N4J4V1_9PEZI|nr:hypothetical protein L873DRAFT_83677 [Choiromyces venosus 120613-1]
MASINSTHSCWLWPTLILNRNCTTLTKYEEPEQSIMGKRICPQFTHLWLSKKLPMCEMVIQN